MARILVVDDDEGIRTLLGDVLSVANHQIDTAATVKTARALLELNFYNLLLADLMLPDGSGIPGSRGSPAPRHPGHHPDCLRPPLPEG